MISAQFSLLTNYWIDICTQNTSPRDITLILGDFLTTCTCLVATAVMIAHVSYERCDLKLCLYPTAKVWSSSVYMKCHLWQRLRSGSSITDLTNERTRAREHTRLRSSPRGYRMNSNAVATFLGRWHATSKISPQSVPSGVTRLPVDKCYCGLKETQKSMWCTHTRSSFTCIHIYTGAVNQVTR